MHLPCPSADASAAPLTTSAVEHVPQAEAPPRTAQNGPPTGASTCGTPTVADQTGRGRGGAPRGRRPPRLPQIDVMRLLICATVVATHVVSNANPIQSVPPNAVVNSLHYSRQAFFFISSLVLVYTSWPRLGADGWLTRAPGQMRRRVSVLGTPYLLWSAFYALLGLVTAYSLWAAKRLPWTYLVGLVQGTDGYHMYFLLVSVEFAIVFPLFVKVLHASGHSPSGPICPSAST